MTDTLARDYIDFCNRKAISKLLAELTAGLTTNQRGGTRGAKQTNVSICNFFGARTLVVLNLPCFHKSLQIALAHMKLDTRLKDLKEGGDSMFTGNVVTEVVTYVVDTSDWPALATSFTRNHTQTAVMSKQRVGGKGYQTLRRGIHALRGGVGNNTVPLGGALDIAGLELLAPVAFADAETQYILDLVERKYPELLVGPEQSMRSIFVVLEEKFGSGIVAELSPLLGTFGDDAADEHSTALVATNQASTAGATEFELLITEEFGSIFAGAGIDEIVAADGGRTTLTPFRARKTIEPGQLVKSLASHIGNQVARAMVDEQREAESRTAENLSARFSGIETDLGEIKAGNADLKNGQGDILSGVQANGAQLTNLQETAAAHTEKLNTLEVAVEEAEDRDIARAAEAAEKEVEKAAKKAEKAAKEAEKAAEEAAEEAEKAAEKVRKVAKAAEDAAEKKKMRALKAQKDQADKAELMGAITSVGANVVAKVGGMLDVTAERVIGATKEELEAVGQGLASSFEESSVLAARKMTAKFDEKIDGTINEINGVVNGAAEQVVSKVNAKVEETGDEMAAGVAPMFARIETLNEETMQATTATKAAAERASQAAAVVGVAVGPQRRRLRRTDAEDAHVERVAAAKSKSAPRAAPLASKENAAANGAPARATRSRRM